jgi:hypothetical protein
VLVEKATLLGTTNGVRIKTWQVIHGLLAKRHENLDSSGLFKKKIEEKGCSQKQQCSSTTFYSSISQYVPLLPNSFVDCSM